MRAYEFLTEDPNTNVSQVQSNITNKIQGIFDLDELNKIYSYIRKVDLGGGFEQIFSRDIDLKQVQTVLSRAIVDANGSFEDKMEFAKELVTKGIIDVDALLTAGQTYTIPDLVSTQYPQIYDSIANELMNISGSFKSGDKKTVRGKGEFFLAILSPEIMLSKIGQGDLTIRGKGYEVKDNLARIKGRKGYGSTNKAVQDITIEVSKYIDAQVKKNPQSPLAGQTFGVGVGAKQNFWTEFGPLAIQGGAQPADIIKFIKKQWAKIIKSLFLNITNQQLASVSPFDTNGVLDFAALLAPMKMLAFDYYKAADGFDGVLFVNSQRMTITYVETAEQFNQLIGIKKYGFEVGQQNGMQISTP